MDLEGELSTEDSMDLKDELSTKDTRGLKSGLFNVVIGF